MSLLLMVAGLVGFVSSYYLAVMYSRLIMLLIYHVPFYVGRSYLNLYDALESEETYKVLGGSRRFKSRAQFAKQYDDVRRDVDDRFRKEWNAYAVSIGRPYGVVIGVSIILFWWCYWMFLIPFVVVQAAGLAYLWLVKKKRSGFFATLMIGIVLADQSNRLQ